MSWPTGRKFLWLLAKVRDNEGRIWDKPSEIREFDQVIIDGFVEAIQVGTKACFLPCYTFTLTDKGAQALVGDFHTVADGEHQAAQIRRLRERVMNQRKEIARLHATLAVYPPIEVYAAAPSLEKMWGSLEAIPPSAGDALEDRSYLHLLRRVIRMSCLTVQTCPAGYPDVADFLRAEEADPS